MKTYTEKLKYIEKLIKICSAAYGGDDEEFMDEYIKEVLEKNKANISAAISCFEDLIRKSPHAEKYKDGLEL